MINGALQAGERVVSANTLAKWEATVLDGWTVTIRPDRIDADRTPLDFAPGMYSAHDYKAYFDKELLFVVVVAEVFADGVSLAHAEASGIEWRHGEPRNLYVGHADVDSLLPEVDRQRLVGDAVQAAMRGGGAVKAVHLGRRRER